MPGSLNAPEEVNIVNYRNSKGTNMDLPNLGTNPELDDIMQRARKYDIEENLLDLAMYGFTVVPPEKLGTTNLTERLRTAILKVYEDRSGRVEVRLFTPKAEEFGRRLESLLAER